MKIKAIFHRKEPQLDLKHCEFNTVVCLPDEKYQRFLKNMTDDYDFIRQRRDEMYQEGDVVHCILVKGENSTDGILVNSEGSGYARYAAYFPAAQSFLNEQQLEQQVQPQRREISQEELVEMYTQHVLWGYGPEGAGEQAVFSDCILSGLDMRGMQFNNAIFWNAVLEQMDMQSAGVCFGEFQGAHFINCNMDHLCADEADFKDCSFDGCTMNDAMLQHCNLSHTQFKDTVLDGADLRWSCIEGMEVPEEVIAQANTKNVSFSECSWIEEANIGEEPAMQMGGM